MRAAARRLSGGGRIFRALAPLLAVIFVTLATWTFCASPAGVSAATSGTETPVDGTPTPTATASFADQSSIIEVAPAAKATATPTSTPTATPTPTSTSTPTPTANATPSSTPTPTATSTPGVPTPTATSTPSGGTIRIAPNNSANGNPGATLPYSHVITNTGRTFDYANVTISSSSGWAVFVFQSDGVTPLTDTNSDGIPDTGRLSSGQSTTIIVKIVIPAGGLAGAQDITTVTAVSGRNPTPVNSASATDTTTVNGVLSLTLSTSSSTFGNVSPSGDADPSAIGVSSYPDAQGSYYVDGGGPSQPAVRVTISSNGAWSGGCWAGENTGTASTVQVSQGYLEWTQAGNSTWSALVTAVGSPPYDNACFPSRGIGTNEYGFDYRLRINWTDSPGSFSSVVTYAASQ